MAKDNKNNKKYSIETYTMSEIELSKFCREEGLYVEKVRKWGESCIRANDAETVNSKELKQELQ